MDRINPKISDRVHVYTVYWFNCVTRKPPEKALFMINCITSQAGKSFYFSLPVILNTARCTRYRKVGARYRKEGTRYRKVDDNTATKLSYSLLQEKSAMNFSIP